MEFVDNYEGNSPWVRDLFVENVDELNVYR